MIIPDGVVILIAILGAAGAMMICAAIHRSVRAADYVKHSEVLSQEQADYMREVRKKAWDFRADNNV